MQFKNANGKLAVADLEFRETEIRSISLTYYMLPV